MFDLRIVREDYTFLIVSLHAPPVRKPSGSRLSYDLCRVAGPEHDVNQRVLEPMKRPIPRLYVAGEISSIYGHLYLEAGNITECFVAGKIAGQNAAAEQVWD